MLGADPTSDLKSLLPRSIMEELESYNPKKDEIINVQRTNLTLESFTN
ncbi:unnamed protein product [marine sediment metagenome]|uniref:Uncharacterized protein n=1 Tax=marine sediment metagenome TaxID=412755 RepID=X1H5I9_9ZZZZ